jgi:hypothetical protein
MIPADKRGRVVCKSGAIEWIYWQSGTAQLPPRLIAARLHDPFFLTDRKAPARNPTLDTCPTTGRARLTYRRAEEILYGPLSGLRPARRRRGRTACRLPRPGRPPQALKIDYWRLWLTLAIPHDEPEWSFPTQEPRTVPPWPSPREQDPHKLLLLSYTTGRWDLLVLPPRSVRLPPPG